MCFNISQSKSLLKKFSFSIAVCMFSVCVCAQADVVSTGGVATGVGGNITYSVGQVATQHISDATISLSEGVQQPYEISVIGTDNYQNITLNAILYPNPTQGNLQLTIRDFQMENGELHVYDINGKYLLTKKIEGENTRFDISEYAAGTYFVNVMNGKSLLKSFKVVKTSN